MANKRFLTVKTRFPTMPQAMARLGVDEGGRVQRRLTELVAENLPDFMPQETGGLVSGVSVKNPTIVRVEGPYARFLFFGVRANGEPVHYDNDNPRGGAHWDLRLVDERGPAIVSMLKREMRMRT